MNQRKLPSKRLKSIIGATKWAWSVVRLWQNRRRIGSKQCTTADSQGVGYAREKVTVCLWLWGRKTWEAGGRKCHVGEGLHLGGLSCSRPLHTLDFELCLSTLRQLQELQ
jgi:hypothetical protein